MNKVIVFSRFKSLLLLLLVFSSYFVSSLGMLEDEYLENNNDNTDKNENKNVNNGTNGYTNGDSDLGTSIPNGHGLVSLANEQKVGADVGTEAYYERVNNTCKRIYDNYIIKNQKEFFSEVTTEIGNKINNIINNGRERNEGSNDKKVVTDNNDEKVFIANNDKAEFLNCIRQDSVNTAKKELLRYDVCNTLYNILYNDKLARRNGANDDFYEKNICVKNAKLSNDIYFNEIYQKEEYFLKKENFKKFQAKKMKDNDKNIKNGDIILNNEEVTRLKDINELRDRCLCLEQRVRNLFDTIGVFMYFNDGSGPKKIDESSIALLPGYIRVETKKDNVVKDFVRQADVLKDTDNDNIVKKIHILSPIKNNLGYIKRVYWYKKKILKGKQENEKVNASINDYRDRFLKSIYIQSNNIQYMLDYIKQRNRVLTKNTVPMINDAKIMALDSLNSVLSELSNDIEVYLESKFPRFLLKRTLFFILCSIISGIGGEANNWKPLSVGNWFSWSVYRSRIFTSYGVNLQINNLPVINTLTVHVIGIHFIPLLLGCITCLLTSGFVNVAIDKNPTGIDCNGTQIQKEELIKAEGLGTNIFGTIRNSYTKLIEAIKKIKLKCWEDNIGYCFLSYMRGVDGNMALCDIGYLLTRRLLFDSIQICSISIPVHEYVSININLGSVLLQGIMYLIYRLTLTTPRYYYLLDKAYNKCLNMESSVRKKQQRTKEFLSLNRSLLKNIGIGFLPNEKTAKKQEAYDEDD